MTKRVQLYKAATVVQYIALGVMFFVCVVCMVQGYWLPLCVLVPTGMFLSWIVIKTHIPWKDIEKELGK